MAEPFEITTGWDTHVNEVIPTQNNAAVSYHALRSGNELRILLLMPLAAAQISGKTILSATLSGVAQGLWVDQTITAQALDGAWQLGTVTWANKPGVTGATASSGATGALAAGTRFEIDVTALVQAIADGQANWGWQLTTNQSTDRSTVRGFRSGHASWVLTLEVSDVPTTPSQLSPEGVIATGTPVVTVDEVDDLAQIQVQVDAAADSVSPDFDSGWRSVTTPRLDLSAGMDRTVAVTTTNGSATITYASGALEAADVGHAITGTGIPGGTTILTAGATSGTISANATASGAITATVTRTYAGLADGATTSWRARVKRSDTSTSEWSDWVEMTREDQPAIVDDTGTTIYDPAQTFEAHLNPAGDADTRWQLIIRDVTDPANVRYDSGDALTGAALNQQVPLLWNGQVVFPSDGTYERVIRAWDRSDRVPTEGFPTYVVDVATVTLGTEAAVVVPTDVTATQTDEEPTVTVAWSCTGTPTRFGIFNDDDEIVAMVEADDAEVAPGDYEFAYGSFTPNKADNFTIRAIADNAGVMSQSVSSAAAAATPTISGVWLRSSTAAVKFFGRDGMVARQVDKRETYNLPYRGESVDIITAIGGIEGTFKGGLRAPTAATLAQLETWRQSGERLRVVWGKHNILADIKGLSVTMDPRSASTVLYEVEFGFSQVDES